MTSLQLLTNARSKVSDINCWTQHTFSRDVKGKVTEPKNPSATCWCAVGALEASKPTTLEYHSGALDIGALALVKLDSASRILARELEPFNPSTLGIYGATTLNDDPSLSPVLAHSRVLRAFDLAIVTELARNRN
jgi:hypothetical protein